MVISYIGITHQQPSIPLTATLGASKHLVLKRKCRAHWWRRIRLRQGKPSRVLSPRVIHGSRSMWANCTPLNLIGNANGNFATSTSWKLTQSLSEVCFVPKYSNKANFETRSITTKEAEIEGISKSAGVNTWLLSTWNRISAHDAWYTNCGDELRRKFENNSWTSKTTTSVPSKKSTQKDRNVPILRRNEFYCGKCVS